MLLLSKVARRLKPSFSTLISTYPVIHSGCLMYFGGHFISILIIPTNLGFFMFFESFFSHFFISLHHLFLLLCKFSLLRLELFLALIYCPRSLELTCCSISRLLSLKFELSPVSLSGLGRTIFHVGFSINTSHMVWEDLSAIVTRVESMAKILKVMVLLIELSWVYMDLLNHTSKVVLLTNYLVSCLKFGQLTKFLLRL